MGLVSDYFSFQNGYAFKSSDFTENGEYKIVKIKELKDGSVKFFEDTAEVSPSGDFDVEKYIIRRGDVLFALTGDPVNKPNPLSWVGRVSYYTHDEPALLNQRVCKAVPKNDVPSEYLYYFFRQNSEFYNLASKATGSASQANISTKTIEQHVMDIPDSDTIKKIVDFMRTIDDTIETNNQINRNLSEQAKAVYNERFGLLEKTKVLEDYPVRIYSGGTPSTAKKEYWENGDIHWLSSGETANEFVTTTEKTITQLGVDNSSTKWARKYDVATASAGQGHTRGQTTMILLDTCINQSVIVTHAEREYMPFIFFNISGRYEELRVLSDGTSTRGSLTTKIMAKLEMPDVTENDIKAFSEYAWPIISQIEVNLKENERLIELRDSLLPRLMSGELDVSDLDI